MLTHLSHLVDRANRASDVEIETGWQLSAKSIVSQHQAALACIKGDQPVYGATTQCGHRDSVSLPSGGQKSPEHRLMLDQHRIGVGPYMSPFEARCVGYAKLSQWSAGGSGVSPEVFEGAIRAATDPDFKPAIPLSASYSAGDVIPAAHWAQALLSHLGAKPDEGLVPTDFMALINGSFVATGYAWSMMPKIHSVATAIQNNSTLLAGLLGQVYDTPSMTTDEVGIGSPDPLCKLPRTAQQLPVSIRGFAGARNTWINQVERCAEDVSTLLDQPSASPLFLMGDAGQCSAQSTDHYLTPNLSISLGACIEASLMLGWLIVSRTKMVLSGTLPGIPRDLVSEGEPGVGWIQRPKLMTAWLEQARTECGRRSYASGGETSYGTEDFWCHTMTTTRQLGRLLTMMDKLLMVEHQVLQAAIDQLGH